jgi:tight adherence protein B
LTFVHNAIDAMDTTMVAVVAMVAIFVALIVLVATALGVFNRKVTPEERVLRRLDVYTLTGGRTPTRVATQEETSRPGASILARSAVDLVGRVVQRRDFADSIDSRLEAAGLPIRTAEWLLLHVGASVGGALLFWLLGRGRPAALVIGLAVGFALPWIFLSMRQSRRESKFLSQLPDTLQLLAGSLQAGYSLPQAMDSVVREAGPPISTEFNRALIETRLGMPAEDALEGIAARTHSRDFAWVVMAIRIQREVGGNLAELLGSVSGTLRERERLHRQVKSLSAEGRLSAWILALLPLAFTSYLVIARPDYLRPLYTTSQGQVMLLIAVTLLAIGVLWLSRVVKVTV